MLVVFISLMVDSLSAVKWIGDGGPCEGIIIVNWLYFHVIVVEEVWQPFITLNSGGKAMSVGAVITFTSGDKSGEVARLMVIGAGGDW